MSAAHSGAASRVAFKGNVVTVTIPRAVSFDLQKIQKIQAELVSRLGHSACYSGFDILFQEEREFIVDPASLALRGLG
jgi:hypothetical protein